MRHATASQWTAVNPILGSSELGTESDTGRSKLGDGVTAWTSLGYYVASTPRFAFTGSVLTPAINTDNVDAFSITALGVNITSFTTNLSGTPTNFQKLIIRIKDDGTARTISWGSAFEAGSVALPTTTVAGKTLLVGFIYDAVDSKWACEAAGSRA